MKIFFHLFLLFGVISTCYAYKSVYLPEHSLNKSRWSEWEFGGSFTNHSTDSKFFMMTPAEPSKKGYAWNNVPVTHKNWSVTLVLQITGGSIGGDGLAFWYTKSRMVEGNAYGSAEKFEGLAVAIDTYDNDGDGQNPTLLSTVNDNSYAFDRFSDGKTHAFGQCVDKFRNTKTPFKVEIAYYDGELSVSYSLSLHTDFELCFKSEVSLPLGYYFGISAATGGLSDEHNLVEMTVTALVDSTPPPPPPPPPQAHEEIIPHKHDSSQENVVPVHVPAHIPAQEPAPPSPLQPEIDSLTFKIKTVSNEVQELIQIVKEQSQAIATLKATLASSLASKPANQGIASESIDSIKVLLSDLRQQGIDIQQQSRSVGSELRQHIADLPQVVKKAAESAGSNLPLYAVILLQFVIIALFIANTRSSAKRDKFY